MYVTTDDAPLIQFDGRRAIVRLSDAPDGLPRFVELRRPNMVELARFYELAVQADDTLPKPPPPPAGLEQASELRQLEYTGEVQEVMRQRTVRMHSLESPHGLALLIVLQTLTGTVYEMADLDPYFMDPKALRSLLAHWEAPLVGRVPDDASATANGANASPVPPPPSAPDSPAEAPTSGLLPGTADSGQPSPAT